METLRLELTLSQTKAIYGPELPPVLPVLAKSSSLASPTHGLCLHALSLHNTHTILSFSIHIYLVISKLSQTISKHKGNTSHSFYPNTTLFKNLSPLLSYLKRSNVMMLCEVESFRIHSLFPNMLPFLTC